MKRKKNKKPKRERNRSTRAARSCANPAQDAGELVLAGVELHQLGRIDEAVKAYRRALEKDPDLPDAHNLLGMILIDEGKNREAAAHIARAVEISPEVAQYHLNLGNAFSAGEADELAVEAFERAARLDPTNTVARFNRGQAWLRQNRSEEAVRAFREVLAIEPGHSRASFLVAGMTGEQRDAPPPEYVAELFDDYANRFEQHVQAKLSYKIPSELRDAVAEVVALPRASWNVVDLGCGTGLCAPLFRDSACQLVGSDLSARMVAESQGRGLYDALYVEDLLETLARAEGVDLITAADVFIYVGALAATLSAARSALKPGGLLAFSIEHHDGDGEFRLLASCRYAHTVGYVRRLAGDNGFEVAIERETTIRTEDHVALHGHVYVLRKLSSAAR